jgi:site-specific DNA-methyltransferase (adenine-specific)
LIFVEHRYTYRYIAALEDYGFTFQGMFVWEKSTASHRAQRMSEIFRRRVNKADAENWSSWRVANLRPLFEPYFMVSKAI